MCINTRQRLNAFAILLLCFQIAMAQNVPPILRTDMSQYMSNDGNYSEFVALCKFGLCSGQRLPHSFFPTEPVTLNRRTRAEHTAALQSPPTPIVYNPQWVPQQNSFTNQQQFSPVIHQQTPIFSSLDEPSDPYPKVSEIPQQTPINPIPNTKSNPGFRFTPPTYSTPVQSQDVDCGREGLTPSGASGHDFRRGKFPWLAAIYLRNFEDLKFTCVGSLISSRTVITAAHCFPTPTFAPDRIIVSLGRHNLFVSEEGSIHANVTSMTVHPEYNISAISDADIALLYLSSSVNFNQYIRPICLWSQSSDISLFEDQKGFIAGWGSDNNDKSVSSVARVVEAKIVSESECLRSSDIFLMLTSSRTLCAGNRDGTGPCAGDAGGGLMLKVSGVWTLRGILSTVKTIGPSCDLNAYVVYCDVAKHISWIRENVRD